MEDVQFSGDARVIFPVEHDLIRCCSAGVIAGLFDREHILLFSVPTPNEMPIEVVASIIDIDRIIESKIESDFYAIDKRITALIHP